MRFLRSRPWVAGVLALALVIGIPFSASAADVDAEAVWAPWASMRAIAEMPPLYILGSEKEWSYPDIDGKYAVYQRRLVDGNGTLPGTTPGDWNIYVRNLNTGSEIAVTEAAGDQQFARISGDWVVYVDEAGSSDEVKAFKISSRTPKTVTDRANDQNAPDVDGSWVAYEDNGTVRLYNLSTGADSSFANPGADPAMSDGRVVFRQGTSIVINDIVEENVITLAADAGNEWMPRIDGDYVVFMDEVGALDFDIVKYTISTADYKVIASGASQTSMLPDVSGTIAIWETYGSAAPYLEAYDFVKDKVVTIANVDPTHLTQPMISGNRFVCVSAASSFIAANGDIELGTIKAPTAALSGPSEVAYGAKPVLTGRLTENGDGLGGKSLDVLKSTNGGFTWTKIGTKLTDENGSFSYQLPAAYTRAWYAVRFNGEEWGFITTSLSRFSALSNAKSVNVRASLGRPNGYPSPANDTKTYTVYGSLKPRQTAAAASAGVVVIKCYRRQSGKWKLRKTVNAKVYDYSTYSRYKASVKLPYTGRWRIRAYFKGTATNAAKSSSYRYARVR